LSVHDFGEGPPVLLLHAAIVDAWAWEPLTPFLLDAGYRVVAFDRRDTGDSRTDRVEYSNRADVIAVLDALGLERAVLIGNSVGGQIALETAVEFPPRAMAVVPVGATIPGWFPGMTAEERAIDDELVRLEETADAEAIADTDVRAWVDGPGQPADRVPDDIRELVREMDRAINATGRERGTPLPLQPAASEQLERLTMPVLATAGELDFSYILATVEYLAANAPDARAVVMPGVAHMIGLEAPDELAALITDLLEPLPRW